LNADSDAGSAALLPGHFGSTRGAAQSGTAIQRGILAAALLAAAQGRVSNALRPNVAACCALNLVFCVDRLHLGITGLGLRW